MSVEKRLSEGVDHPMRYASNAGSHSETDMATAVAETLLDTLVDSIVNHPRSLQKRIGPSEMGNPCKRAILHKLNADPEPERPNVPWKPTIGTAAHALMDEYFTKASSPQGREPERWLCEQTLTVGQVAGTDITGSCDLYDRFSGTVIDFKFIGSYSMKTTRASGPGEKYRRQAHLYGRGWETEGWPVRLVMIAFLPRDGELEDAYFWSEPYDPHVAEETLQTVNHLETLRTALGIDAALALYPECGDRWCPWCGTQTTFEPRKPSNSLQLIP